MKLTKPVNQQIFYITSKDVIKTTKSSAVYLDDLHCMMTAQIVLFYKPDGRYTMIRNNIKNLELFVKKQQNILNKLELLRKL